MTQEEKAKAYDKALEKARQLCTYPTTQPFISDLQDLFPELRESEDERIRKALLRFHKSSIDVDGIKGEKIIAWLEKQGVQESFYWKPTEEQLEALDYAYNSCPDTEKGNYYEGVLESLIEDLHRLEKQGEKPQGKSALEAIKERYTWKPSDGQLECLGYAIEKAEKDWFPLTNNRIYLTLKALKEQLLELRESKV